jgi:hypothetical protein
LRWVVGTAVSFLGWRGGQYLGGLVRRRRGGGLAQLFCVGDHLGHGQAVLERGSCVPLGGQVFLGQVGVVHRGGGELGAGLVEAERAADAAGAEVVGVVVGDAGAVDGGPHLPDQPLVDGAPVGDLLAAVAARVASHLRCSGAVGGLFRAHPHRLQHPERPRLAGVGRAPLTREFGDELLDLGGLVVAGAPARIARSGPRGGVPLALSVCGGQLGEGVQAGGTQLLGLGPQRPCGVVESVPAVADVVEQVTLLAGDDLEPQAERRRMLAGGLDGAGPLDPAHVGVDDHELVARESLGIGLLDDADQHRLAVLATRLADDNGVVVAEADGRHGRRRDGGRHDASVRVRLDVGWAGQSGACRAMGSLPARRPATAGAGRRWGR